MPLIRYWTSTIIRGQWKQSWNVCSKQKTLIIGTKTAGLVCSASYINFPSRLLTYIHIYSYQYRSLAENTGQTLAFGFSSPLPVWTSAALQNGFKRLPMSRCRGFLWQRGSEESGKGRDESSVWREECAGTGAARAHWRQNCKEQYKKRTIMLLNTSYHD